MHSRNSPYNTYMVVNISNKMALSYIKNYEHIQGNIFHPIIKLENCP